MSIDLIPAAPPACELLSGRTLTLSNGVFEMEVNVPGAPGTYRGARFSWAGIIARAQVEGHRLFGPWRSGSYPEDEHDAVTGTAGEFGMGIAGMPPPLGFDEAVTKGCFIKIGVGVLRRPDLAPYAFARRYEIVETPPWQVLLGGTTVAMRQRLAYGDYGYRYEHLIELVPGRAAFITRHTLHNTGRHAIRQTHYSHNFLVVDQRPMGPACDVTFPFVPSLRHGLDGLVYVEGRSVKFRETIPEGQAVFTPLSGFGDESSDNQVTYRDRAAGVEISIRGDRPVERYHLFAVAGAVCPEPFVGIHAHPGERFTWQHRYDLVCQASPATEGLCHA